MGGVLVIADASPLILYARVQRLDVLFRVAGPVRVTEAVRAECIDAAPERADARALSAALDAGRVSLVPVEPRRLTAVRRRFPNLARGEASTLAAAMQHGERVVLLDEGRARRAAALLGLRPVGSLGVLRLAHHSRALPSKEALAETIRDMVAAGMWVSPVVIETFWKDVGGR